MRTHSLKPLAIALSISVALTACGQKQESADSQASAPAPAPAAAATEAPAVKHVAFDTNEIDTSINACQDFNGYVNSKWIAANPIPADKTRWGAFDQLRESSLNTQHEIVEAAAKSDAPVGTIKHKIGTMYKAGMDEAAIDALGYDPIKPELAKIDALKTSKDIVAYLNDSFSRGQGSVFAFGAETDFKNSSRKIAYAFQGGLGLPTRDYYDKPEHADLRDAYVAHVAKVLELIGTDADAAKKQAAAVLAFETRLAKASLAPVELRVPENQYHFVTIAEADKVTPHFDWKAFFTTQKADVTDGFSLSQPKFFAELDKMLAKTPVADWQAYLRYHHADDASPYLSTPFQQENFAFHKQTLNGQKEDEPRWKRVLRTVNNELGMALGELYVAEAFPPESKARAEELVTNVQAALKSRIENLDWMSDATKTKALEKWSTFLPKIGYPEKWRDWSGLTLNGDSYFADVAATTQFNHDYDIAKIGKPTDRKDWAMTPQTVNAYYNPTDNTINFPAAILQPPFFDAKADDAINYGGIGAVIGHEASHGFDDQGSQFDAQGNNTNWWTDEDRKAFEARTKKLVDQFNAYEPLPGKHVNGQLTLGENIADLGGTAIAYDALQVALKKNPAEAGEKIDGYTEDQRFFLNWARVWRGNTRDKRLEVSLNTDPHSPTSYRAIGAPSNMPAFAKAFDCKSGDAMVRDGDSQVKIW
ncbi:MAG TPA: M13 family metallopeptidase [Dokdonella sp.]|uniref:M13 family metallopeptidase n=1 Tax=Dokdonella sp. TaxID=2291710 RepID=UPI002D80EC59|nr:M13 family metallopeptidase [Dokdonella sp.]HET9032449.1 M13 family metallopeptidase [Dokdonella sp.]